MDWTISFDNGRVRMRYLKFAAKYLLLLLLMSVIIFGITRSMPVGPVDLLLQQLKLPATPENIRMIEVKWGLDQPLYQQYFKWISSFLVGDWGRSLLTGQDIRTEIFRGMPYSVGLGLGGVVIASILGFFGGYLAAVRKKGFFDRFTSFLSLFSQTVPVFILSVILIYYIGVKYQLVKIFTGHVGVKMSLAMAMVVFSSVGSISRVMRKHFLQIAQQPYIRAEIARGFQAEKALMVAGLRPALIGLCSTVVSKFAWVIGGTAVVEFVFAVPGVSFFLVNSIAQRDYHVIQSYLFFIVLWMMFVHFVFSVIIWSLGEKI